LLLADSTFRGTRDAPVCAAIWRKGKGLERITLSARPPFSTPLYGMVLSAAVGPKPIVGARDLAVVRRPPASIVVTELTTYGMNRVVVLNVPLSFGSLGKFGEMLAAGGADAALMEADLAVHEGFHLHAQFPRWLDQKRTYSWPKWDQQPDRAEMRRCYAASPELKRAFETEMRALIDAFDAVALDPAKRDRTSALQYARRFIELRAARRQLQDTIAVAQGGGRIPCGFAEDLMELEEGATQWIGHATTVRAGLTTTARLRGSYATSQPDEFYRSGPLQFWVLDGLLGHDALRRITISIARSTKAGGRSGGVFAQFKYQIERLTESR
jgi:hypothetical protein